MTTDVMVDVTLSEKAKVIAKKNGLFLTDIGDIAFAFLLEQYENKNERLLEMIEQRKQEREEKAKKTNKNILFGKKQKKIDEEYKQKAKYRTYYR